MARLLGDNLMHEWKQTLSSPPPPPPPPPPTTTTAKTATTTAGTVSVGSFTAVSPRVVEKEEDFSVPSPKPVFCDEGKCPGDDRPVTKLSHDFMQKAAEFMELGRIVRAFYFLTRYQA